jgi:hypothetical protein
MQRIDHPEYHLAENYPDWPGPRCLRELSLISLLGSSTADIMQLAASTSYTDAKYLFAPTFSYA